MSGAVLNGGGPLSSGCAPPPGLESEKFGVGDPGGGVELSGTNRGPPPPGPPPHQSWGQSWGGRWGGHRGPSCGGRGGQQVRPQKWGGGDVEIEPPLPIQLTVIAEDSPTPINPPPINKDC